jgi:mannose-6-phosphate isomerase-like protein (cupin superfamily)
MRIRTVTAALLVCSSLPGSAQPPAAAHAAHIMTTPDKVAWSACPPFLPAGALCATLQGDPSVPNALFTLRSKLPDGYVIAPHTHPADEHLTILSGAIEVGLGEKFDAKALQRLPAGSYAMMAKNSPHYLRTRGETVLQVNALGPLVFTYVNPADDPTKR